MKNYQKKILEIIDRATTEKTFSLEIIEKIKELKDGFSEAIAKIEKLEEEKEQRMEQYRQLETQHGKVCEKLKKLDSQKKKVRKERVKQKELAYTLEFQQKRADEIKELFGVVFKNPVILRSQMKGHVYKDNNGYSQQSTTNDSEREEIQ